MSELNYNTFMKNVKTKVIITNYDEVHKYVTTKHTPPKPNNVISDNDNLPGETWTTIPQYKKTQVSNYCRFRNDIGSGLYRLLEKKLVILNDLPYEHVYLNTGVDSFLCRVDRVMYSVFCDPEFPIYWWNHEYTIDHLDGNTLNNDPENLLKIKIK